MKALHRNDWGAGALLVNPAEQRSDKGDTALPDGAEMMTFNGHVDPDWTDYNGHMTEFRYLDVFSQTKLHSKLPKPLKALFLTPTSDPDLGTSSIRLGHVLLTCCDRIKNGFHICWHSRTAAGIHINMH